MEWRMSDARRPPLIATSHAILICELCFMAECLPQTHGVAHCNFQWCIGSPLHPGDA